MPTKSSAVDALHRVQAVSRHFHGFDEYEVARLASAMSIVDFKEGESILESGETASWFGILISGLLEAVITPELRFPIYRGELIGEQSFFACPSTRSATVVSATDGIMGLFTFDELAAFVREEPALGVRLVRVLGHSSADKLEAERASAMRDVALTRSVTTWDQLSSPTEMLRLFTRVASKSPDLSSLSAVECENLFSVASVVPFAAGDVLVTQGEEVPFAAVVLSGQLRVGEERVLKEGDTLCERRLFELGSLAQPKRVVGVAAGSLLAFSRHVLLDDKDSEIDGNGARKGIGGAAAAPGGGPTGTTALARQSPELAVKVLHAFGHAALRDMRADIHGIRTGGCAPAPGEEEPGVTVGASASGPGLRASGGGGAAVRGEAKSSKGGGAGASGAKKGEVFLRNRLIKQDLSHKEDTHRVAREMVEVEKEKFALQARVEKLTGEAATAKHVLQKERKLMRAVEASKADLEAQLEEQKARVMQLERKRKQAVEGLVQEQKARALDVQELRGQAERLISELATVTVERDRCTHVVVAAGLEPPAAADVYFSEVVEADGQLVASSPSAAAAPPSTSDSPLRLRCWLGWTAKYGRAS